MPVHVESVALVRPLVDVITVGVVESDPVVLCCGRVLGTQVANDILDEVLLDAVAYGDQRSTLCFASVGSCALVDAGRQVEEVARSTIAEETGRARMNCNKA